VADAFPAGLAGYNLTVTLNDPSVAAITAVSFPEWVDLNATGDLPAGSVFIKAADLGASVSAGATDVTLATLTLSGVDAGTSSITATVTLMDADDGSAIETAVTDGEIVVLAGVAFPGCESFPHDLNGDGICEDVNGNGFFDFDDIVVFFNAIEWATANEPAEILDVNDNGRIDFADLVGLYQMI
jgi:PKD repeat protein